MTGTCSGGRSHIDIWAEVWDIPMHAAHSPRASPGLGCTVHTQGLGQHLEASSLGPGTLPTPKGFQPQALGCWVAAHGCPLVAAFGLCPPDKCATGIIN